MGQGQPLLLTVVFRLWPKNPLMTQNDDFCLISSKFFSDKKYKILSSQGDMGVESVVI